MERDKEPIFVLVRLYQRGRLHDAFVVRTDERHLYDASLLPSDGDLDIDVEVIS